MPYVGTGDGEDVGVVVGTVVGIDLAEHYRL